MRRIHVETVSKEAKSISEAISNTAKSAVPAFDAAKKGIPIFADAAHSIANKVTQVVPFGAGIMAINSVISVVQAVTFIVSKSHLFLVPSA